MKKFLLLIMLMGLALAGCRVVPSEGAVSKAPESPEPQWEYQWIISRCVHDGGTGRMVCIDPGNGDQTFLDGIVKGMAEQGYELDEIMHSSSKEGIIQTFIFRRPYTAAVVEE